MLDIHPFIAENAANFINPFQTPYNKALQVQFRRNAQVQIDIKGIMVVTKGAAPPE